MVLLASQGPLNWLFIAGGIYIYIYIYRYGSSAVSVQTCCLLRLLRTMPDRTRRALWTFATLGAGVLAGGSMPGFFPTGWVFLPGTDAKGANLDPADRHPTTTTTDKGIRYTSNYITKHNLLELIFTHNYLSGWPPADSFFIDLPASTKIYGLRNLGASPIPPTPPT